MLNFDIDEAQIKEELDRQESKSVNLLFAYKWFYSEQSNKGGKSQLLSNLFEERKNESPKYVKTENELMTLVYMSYLETNNFAKINKKFLFGEIAKTSNTVF